MFLGREPEVNNKRAPTVLISYSQDSEAHRERVLEFAQWLRRNGIDCILDRFVRPVDWALWMENAVRECDWIIVVATETYLNRARGNEEPGRGLGAIWEYGAIRQGLYESQRLSDRTIPAAFGPADLTFIPDALRTAQRYDLESDASRTELLHRLAGLRTTVEPAPLGDLPVRSEGMPTASNVASGRATIDTSRSADPQDKRDCAGPLILIRAKAEQFDGRVASYERGLRETEIMMTVGDERTANGIAALAMAGAPEVLIAFRNGVQKGRVRSATHQFVEGQDLVKLTVANDEIRPGPMGDASYNGVSAEQFAEMRARYILLNEPAEAMIAALGRRPDDSMYGHFLRGADSMFQADRSPIATHLAPPNHRTSRDVELARLEALMMIVATNTVKEVDQLTLSLNQSILRVRFRGRRRHYQDWHEVSVEGELRLP